MRKHLSAHLSLNDVTIQLRHRLVNWHGFINEYTERLDRIKCTVITVTYCEKLLACQHTTNTRLKSLSGESFWPEACFVSELHWEWGHCGTKPGHLPHQKAFIVRILCAVLIAVMLSVTWRLVEQQSCWLWGLFEFWSTHPLDDGCECGLSTN